MPAAPAGRASARGLTVVDAMILVGAAAVGVATYRALAEPLRLLVPGPWLLDAPPRGWTFHSALGRARTIQALTIPCALSWTLALPALRLRRRPRTPWRRLARQPGMAACLAATLGTLWALACLTLMILTWSAPRPPLAAWMARGLERIFPPMGLAVAVAWSVLALAGLWRPVPDAIDRVGRALGVYWMIIGVEWTSMIYFRVL
jgi:hypothetical protein